MVSKVIGVDVGTNAVRAVELELRDPVRLVAMGQVGLPLGAVVDGEVVDVGAVSDALRALWDGAGFSSRSARVAMSSARVIVRTIEMPRLSHAELLSAIRLQLDDYVPLPPDDTTFDVRWPDGSDPTSAMQPLILAATDREAADRLVQAMQGANLKVTAVDVGPAALALALTRVEPAAVPAANASVDHGDVAGDDAESVDIVVSIGAGTVVVVAARRGEAQFSRILTNVSSRRLTEDIARHLGVEFDEAERSRRFVPGDPMSDTALLAAGAGVAEVVEEVFDSVTFFAGQPDALPVRRVLLTGGGSLFDGLSTALTERLGVEVVHANPFEHVQVRTAGYEAEDLPYLAPYMATAIGAALAGGRPKSHRIDLTPSTKSEGSRTPVRRVLVGAGVVLVLGAGGAMYARGRTALADEVQRTDQAQTTLVELQAQLAALAPTSQSPAGATGVAAEPAAVAASVAPRLIDWLGVELAVEAGAAPFGVVVTSFDATLEAPVAPTMIAPAAIDPAAIDPAAIDPAAIDPAAIDTAGPELLGRLTMAANAPSLNAVADWLDALAADPRFDSPLTGGLTMSPSADGTAGVQFTLSLTLTDQNLVGAPSTSAPS
jgi:type IV pilus assembly protein PilM